MFGWSSFNATWPAVERSIRQTMSAGFS